MSNTPKSWAQKVSASKNNRLYGLSCRFPDGRDAWYYVLVDPPKEKAFLKAVDSDQGMELTDYGKVVASGWGTPPEEVKQEMRDTYDADIE